VLGGACCKPGHTSPAQKSSCSSAGTLGLAPSLRLPTYLPAPSSGESRWTAPMSTHGSQGGVPHSTPRLKITDKNNMLNGSRNAIETRQRDISITVFPLRANTHRTPRQCDRIRPGPLRKHSDPSRPVSFFVQPSVRTPSRSYACDPSWQKVALLFYRGARQSLTVATYRKYYWLLSLTDLAPTRLISGALSCGRKRAMRCTRREPSTSASYRSWRNILKGFGCKKKGKRENESAGPQRNRIVIIVEALKLAFRRPAG